MISQLISGISRDQPVLIAGPTASGKSALALAIAEAQGGVVVNADASQVFDCWQVLTARPDADELSRAEHALYGHIAYDQPYSAGHWAREVVPLLSGPARLIIVGGTGLYFAALTEGLADIPATPDAVRKQADDLTLYALLEGVHADTKSRIDCENRARVQRAWEVEQATGTPLHVWQADKTAPIMNVNEAACFVLDAPRDWLTPRIERRFANMLSEGGLAEARAMQSRYDPSLPSCKAIGVHEAMGVLEGTLTEAQAIEEASIATRQYAKRQRTWFRARMQTWQWIAASGL